MSINFKPIWIFGLSKSFILGGRDVKVDKVEPVHNNHFWDHLNMAVIDMWSLYRNTVSNDPLIKWPLCSGFLKKSACQIWRENYLGWNQPFTKFVEAENNLTKLVVVENHFPKFVKLVNNFTKFIELANNFMKFAELANNFMKFVGLVKNFYEVRRSCEQLCKVRGTCKYLLQSP